MSVVDTEMPSCNNVLKIHMLFRQLLGLGIMVVPQITRKLDAHKKMSALYQTGAEM